MRNGVFRCLVFWEGMHQFCELGRETPCILDLEFRASGSGLKIQFLVFMGLGMWLFPWGSESLGFRAQRLRVLRVQGSEAKIL